MATNNKETIKGRIIYVEPNDFIKYSGITYGDEPIDNGVYNPEDYSIAVDLQVIVPDRDSCGMVDYDTQVVLTGLDSGSFLRGSKLNNSDDENYLTTDYTDISYREINGSKSGNAETFGVNSIEISFDSMFFPIVTMNFTDVRGSALMEPAECNFAEQQRKIRADKNGENYDQISYKSFFKTLFHFPYPRFALSVKGFYGTRVTFMLSIQDFKSSFNSATGNFDVTVKFIGNMYGIYSDIPMNYLIVAPYVSASTKNDVNNYWKTQVENGVFQFKDGQPIPTFIELIANYNKMNERFSEIMAMNGLSDENSINKYADIEKLTQLRRELTMIGEIKNEYNRFIGDVRETLNRNAERSIKLIEKNHYIVCFTTQKTINFERGSSELQKKYNEYREIYSLGDVEYTFPFSKSYETKINGSYDENSFYFVLNEEGLKNFDTIFGDQQGHDGINTPIGISKERILKVLNDYNTGSNSRKPLYYCIFKKYDGSGDFYEKLREREKEIEEQISVILQNTNNEDFKELSQEILGFIPNLENIFRIIFAHIDCFIEEFYSTLATIKASNRQTTDYGIITKRETDINSSSNCFLPPFTAFYRENNTTKTRERIYPPYNLEEKELVRAFLDGLSSVNLSQEKLFSNSKVNQKNTEYSFLPTSIVDIFLKGRNPYYDLEAGNDNDGEDYLSRILIKFCKRYATLKVVDNYDFMSEKEDFIEREANNIYKTLDKGDKYNLNSTIEWIFDSLNDSETLEKCIDIINKTGDGDADFSNVFHLLGYNQPKDGKEAYAYTVKTEDLKDIILGYDDEGNEVKLSEHFGCRRLDSDIDIDDFLKRIHKSKKNWEYTKNGKRGDNGTGVRYRVINENDPSRYIYKTVPRRKYNDFVRKDFKSASTSDVIQKEMEESSLIIPFLKEYRYSPKNLYFNDAFRGEDNATKRAVAFLTALVDTDIIFPSEIFGSTCIAEIPQFIELFAGGQIAYGGYSFSSTAAANDGGVLNIYDFLQGVRTVNKVSGLEFNEVPKVIPDCENTFRTWINTGYSDNSFTQIDEALTTDAASEYNEKYIFEGVETPTPYAMGKGVSEMLYNFYMKTDVMINIPDPDIEIYKVPDGISINVTEILSLCRKLQRWLKSDVDSTDTVERKPEPEEYMSDITESRSSELYYRFKGLYDKWLASYTKDRFKLRAYGDTSNTALTEYESFIFTDIYYHDIGEDFIVDMGLLYNQLWEQIEGKSNRSVLEFISDVLQDNKLFFMALPMYNNFRNPESIKEVFKPHSIYNNTDDRTIEINKRSFGNTYLIMYTHEPSNKVEVLDEVTNSTAYENDGLDIADIIDSNLTNIDILSQEGSDYMIPAFGVTFAKQNQSFFKNISINMDSPRETDYSIYNTILLANQEKRGDTNSPIPIGQNMFSIFSNRSYDCSVEMMGCANIMPSMYFQLNNIPMFRGAYVITKVEHKIEAGRMSTRFTGTRISINNIPYNTNVLDIESLTKRITGGVSENDELPYPEIPRETVPIGEEPKLSGDKKWEDIFIFSVRECLNSAKDPYFAQTFLNEMFEKSGESARAIILNKRDLYENGIFNNVGRANSPYGGIGYCCASVARIINEGFMKVYQNERNGYTKRLLLTSKAKNAGSVLDRRGFIKFASTNGLSRNEGNPFNLDNVIIPVNRDERRNWMKQNCKPGDIAVMARANDDSHAGHIAILLGKNGDINDYWVSDYRQKSSKDCWVYGDNADDISFIDLYRYRGKIEQI